MRRKVIVIGPVLPLRGGIAQHTTLLARALAESHDCQTLSFRRLYPKWLFPGQSERDPGYEGHIEARTEYILDSLNPLTWWRTVRRVKQIQPEFVLIPWWTFFLGPLFSYLTWSLKRSGINVVFVCHNVQDHEAAAWKHALTRLVLKQGRRFVVHTRVEADRLKELIPGAVVAVHPHPIYDQFPEPVHQLPRRARVELLFYGFVRPYKGLDVLIEAMGLLKGADVFLTIAGEFWQGEQETRERIAGLGIEDQVEIIARYVSDEETADLFSRANVVVLPYRSATGSGVIPIAYHYRKPVIATRVGGLPDVVVEGMTGWLTEPQPEALRDAIQAIDLDGIAGMEEHIARLVTTLTWSDLTETVMSVPLATR
jgi:glycosyltransferase involved in cell wall biosynthesis